MNINDFARMSLGVGGAIYHSGSDTLTCARADHCFIAIQVLDAATFNATNGLVSVDDDLHLNTQTTASTHKIDTDADPLRDAIDAGVTIYGQWTQIILSGGAIIAYIGPKVS